MHRQTVYDTIPKFLPILTRRCGLPTTRSSVLPVLACLRCIVLASSHRPGLPPKNPGDPSPTPDPATGVAPHPVLPVDPPLLAAVRSPLKSGEDSHCFCLPSSGGTICAKTFFVFSEFLHATTSTPTTPTIVLAESFAQVTATGPVERPVIVVLVTTVEVTCHGRRTTVVTTRTR